MNERYRISSYGPIHYISKWVPFKNSKIRGFWQQISPQYFRKGNALRYATKHHITLENI